MNYKQTKNSFINACLAFFIIFVCITLFSIIFKAIIFNDNIIENREVEHFTGKILDVREADYRMESRYINSCNVIYSDEEGKINEYDFKEMSNETCMRLRDYKEIEIEITKTNRYHKGNEKIIEIIKERKLLLPSDLAEK